MHLTHDEFLTLPIQGEDIAVRLRIWRAQDEPPVVFVTPIEGGPPPAQHTEKLAQFVFEAYLHLNPLGMWYFEGGPAGISVVDFEVIGKRDDRLRFIKPRRHPAKLRNITDLVHQTVTL